MPTTYSVLGASTYADSDLPVGTSASLVGYWPLEEGIGTTTADKSGNANTGTLNNSPPWTAGKFGNALLFDGATTFVQVADAAGLQLPNPNMTVAVWVNPDEALGSSDGIVQKYYSFLAIRSGFGVEYVNDGNVYFTLGSGSTSSSMPVPVSNGVWTHLAFTYDGTTMKGYVNGVLASSAAFAGGTYSTQPLLIGKEVYGGTGWFDGLIDEVRLYSVALTAAQALALYNGSPKPTNSNPVLGQTSPGTASESYVTMDAPYLGYQGRAADFANQDEVPSFMFFSGDPKPYMDSGGNVVWRSPNKDGSLPA